MTRSGQPHRGTVAESVLRATLSTDFRMVNAPASSRVLPFACASADNGAARR
jgi:hypothetical protein